MSIFSDNITSHPFEGVRNMDPVDGLNYVFNMLTGEDFNNIIYQYNRNKIDKDGFNEDIRNTIQIVKPFHPNIAIGLKSISRLYQQHCYKDLNGDIQFEFPDEPLVFIMFGYEWTIMNIM